MAAEIMVSNISVVEFIKDPTVEVAREASSNPSDFERALAFD